MDAELEEEVAITCSVRSPISVNITWSTTANVTVPVAVMSGDTQTGFTSTITIPSATLAHDTAEFVCTAVNSAGNDTDSTIISVTSECVHLVS